MAATEAAVSERLATMPLDMAAMTAVSNLYRAEGAIRNHLEHTVLAPYNLTWTGWVVLWVVWIWQEIETRHVAAEAGISKGTLTGVAGTLEKRGLLRRRAHPDDARRVLMDLTPAWPPANGRALPAVQPAGGACGGAAQRARGSGSGRRVAQDHHRPRNQHRSRLTPPDGSTDPSGRDVRVSDRAAAVAAGCRPGRYRR